MSTAIPAAKEWVMGVLEPLPELADVEVTDDTEPERAKEYVWLYRANAKREFTVMKGGAPPPLEEFLRLYLRVFVVVAGRSAKPAEVRALEIASAVERALREAMSDSPPTAVRAKGLIVEELDDEPQVVDNGRAYHVLMIVRLNARI